MHKCNRLITRSGNPLPLRKPLSSPPSSSTSKRLFYYCCRNHLCVWGGATGARGLAGGGGGGAAGASGRYGGCGSGRTTRPLSMWLSLRRGSRSSTRRAKLTDNVAIVLAAVTPNGGAHHHAPNGPKRNEAIILAVATQGGHALRDASDELKNEAKRPRDCQSE